MRAGVARRNAFALLASTPAAYPILAVNVLPFEAGLVSWARGVYPSTKEEHVKNPLDSLWGTIISGLVLTLILYLIVKAAIGS